MNLFFGGGKSPKEMMRQNQRCIQKAVRDLERERVKLVGQEKKLVADIKRDAKAGEHAALKAIGLKMTTMQSTETMSRSMTSATKSMRAMNNQVKLPQLQKIMCDFEKQSEMMDMKEEMMNDAIDDALFDDEDEEETEEVISKVLDEIGIQTASQFATAPNAALPGLKAQESQAVENAAESEADAALMARLEMLKK